MAVCGHRPAGAQAAQGPTAAGRVISTIWRVVLFEGTIFLVARWILPRHGQSLQKSLNRSGAISVYLTVCWMFLCPR